MLKPNHYLLGLFVFISCIFCLPHLFCSDKQQASEATDTPQTPLSPNIGAPEEPLLNPDDFDTTGIEPGDIILKKGRGPLSAMIVDAMREKESFSHCGIFVRNADSLCIVHSVSKRYGEKDGVQIIGLHAFLQDCVKGHTRVLRYKRDASLRRSFSSKALRYADSSVPFDIEGQNEDTTAMSCLELLYHSTAKAKDIYWPRLNVGEVEWLVFRGLLDTTVFHTVLKK